MKEPPDIAPKDEPLTATEIVSFPASDEARAKRFIEELDGSARYIPQWKKWVMWDGEHWTLDSPGSQIFCRAAGMSKILIEEALTIRDSGVQKKALTAAVGAGNVQRIEALVKIAKHDPEIIGTPELFDTDPWLLGVTNGVVELRTGKHRPAQQNDFVLRKMNVAFDAGATCPDWEISTRTALPDDDVRAFVQRAVGYTLVGTPAEQIVLFMFGSGKNGKSTFSETILKLFGDYGHKAPAKLFLHDRFGKDPEGAIAQLQGRRFVIGSEVPEDAQLAESRIKDLAGDDTLSGRLLFNDDITFTPTHTLWFYGNVRPTVSATDEGLWRRLLLVPFTAYIDEAVRDTAILAKLAGQGPGILNWMLQGCAEWQKRGLGAPEAVKMATADYRESEDDLGQFLDLHCKRSASVSIPKAHLYSAFKAWMLSQGTAERFIPGIKRFGKRMARPGISEERRDAERRWLGVCLKDPKAWPYSP